MVLDASALVELLLNTPFAAAVRTKLTDAREELHAPHLLDVEVSHEIRRLEATGVLDQKAGRAAIEALVQFPLQRHRHDVLLRRVWELRNNVTAYDAMYIALAEALAKPLLTRDRRLAVAAGHSAAIELV